jgi:hypothetical protein
VELDLVSAVSVVFHLKFVPSSFLKVVVDLVLLLGKTTYLIL